MKLTKRLIALLAVLALCLCVTPILAWAAAGDPSDVEDGDISLPLDGVVTVVASGSCGSGLSWKLNTTGVLTISGTGAMDNYSEFEDSPYAPWQPYAESIKQVVIQDGVTSIGDNAFFGCANLTDVQIPNSVITLGISFIGATKVTSIHLGSGVSELWNAFVNCNTLESITVAAGNTSYSTQDGILYNADKTTLILCLPTVSGTLTIADSVTSVDHAAFDLCAQNVTKLVIGKNLTDIDPAELSVLTNVTAFEVAEGNSAYSTDTYGVLFNVDKTTLVRMPNPFTGAYEVPASVTAIGENACWGCSGLTAISMPSVQSIGYGAFYGCSSLTNVVLGDGLTSVGQLAFVFTQVAYTEYENASYLGTASNPYHVLIKANSDNETYMISTDTKLVADGAFADCASLTTVKFDGEKEDWEKIVIGLNNDPLHNARVAFASATGDYTGDGFVTNEDVVYLLWHTLYPEEYSISSNADFNNDGFVTNEDVVYLLWHTLYPTEYPL